MQYSSDISVPVTDPYWLRAPRYTCWHVTLYDLCNPDDEGFTIDTQRHHDRAMLIARGRAKTIEREGYSRESFGDQCFLLKKPGEAYLVTVGGCCCNAKIAEDARGDHLPPLPTRGDA